MTKSPSKIAIQNLPPEAHQIANLIREKNNFLIIGHIRPDGDCLGSCLGLYLALVALGKRARVFTAGPVPDFLGYLPKIDIVETTYPADESFDALLCVDTADAGRVFPGYEPPAENIAVIDHHISNTRYGTMNWINGQATAAAEMIYYLAHLLEVEITPEIATCLYTGIATDTGGFRFSNTTEETFRVASDIVACGAPPAKIAEHVWGSKSPASVKISASVLSTINYEFDGRLAWNEITRQMMQAAGGDESETEGLSGEMRAIRGVEISVLFSETEEGFCRIGFRSKGQVNVSTLAAQLGGGGHKSASGAFLAEEYLPAKKRALEVVRTFLKEHLAARGK